MRTPPTPFDLTEPLGSGRTIIEASAGTGKTFTISTLVTGLVAQEGLDLEEILVVTFTTAATAELKGRIRRQMVEAFHALEGKAGAEEADHLKGLFNAPAQLRQLYAERLDAALTRFDRAQIFTIHGFSQRLLLKLGFRSRLAGWLDPRDLDELLVRRAAEDLIADRFARAPIERVEMVTAADLQAIGKAIATTPDARIVPERDDEEDVPQVRVDMAHRIKGTVARRLQSAGTVIFDDLLTEARDALTDPQIGEDARSLLRRRYTVALIDEAQDTDPIQWEAIRAVFDPSRLVVIGDPKQSIYAFRGADIDSYLTAVRGADAHHTLSTNWRSDGPLIEALDHLLDGATFGDEQIRYSRVKPAPMHRESRLSAAGAALQIRRFAEDYPGPRIKSGNLRLDYARDAVAADAANQIAGLLMSDATLKGEDGWRTIEPGDIAVLCRTRKQVESIRSRLRDRGVPSVAARTGGVFDSPAAQDWRRFMLAVERPHRFDYVRMALTTSLGGLDLAEVASLSDDDVRDHQRRFIRWQSLLHDRGVPALFIDVDRLTAMTTKVLEQTGGERLLTDLGHIAEEMHSVWRRGRVGSLVVWLEAAMDEAKRNARDNVEDSENRQRRLETDAAAVQVLTIHAAKGLEFPVVLVPYLWDSFGGKIEIPVFHEEHSEAIDRPKRRLIDVGGTGHKDFETHKQRAKDEQAAEEGRLLYVALTRARHRLMVWWIEDTGRSHESKLAEVMSRVTEGSDKHRPLQKTIPGVLEEKILPGPEPLADYRPRFDVPPGLEIARLDRPLDYLWRRVSFSSLSPNNPLADGEDFPEQDGRIDEAEEPTMSASAGTGGGEEPDHPRLILDNLPKGPRFGSLIHSLLERVPFKAPDLAAAIRAEHDELTRYSSVDYEADVLVDGLVAMLKTPLGPEEGAPALRDLEPGAYAKEMVFELPVCDQTSQVSLADLSATTLEHLPLDDPYRDYFTLLGEHSAAGFRGYLTGIIDLALALPSPSTGGSRYFAMDFKSNFLTPWQEEAKIADYGPESMGRSMEKGHYVLQSLLYQVALHRYLAYRLPDYRPQNHLGGSIYLYIRGMIGPDTPVIDGERCGVARWFPPFRAIQAVSDLFVGGRG
ncbi:MAG: AAA family ATPase [Acidimicrobiia bacterium]|nr:AAA family ATPase [Acidimicrobiia bacterium]